MAIGCRCSRQLAAGADGQRRSYHVVGPRDAPVAALAAGSPPTGCVAGRGKSELVRCGDRLGDRQLRRSWGCTDRADEHLQLGIAEELLEVLDALPLVDDHHHAVAYAEAMMDRAGHLGLASDLH